MLFIDDDDDWIVVLGASALGLLLAMHEDLLVPSLGVIRMIFLVGQEKG